MESVRDILAAHHSGISKPGLLAWARLRIDTAMTEAQLDAELERLGDDVVDLDGFLYLRDYVDPSRRPPGAGATPGRERAAPAAAYGTDAGRADPWKPAVVATPGAAGWTAPPRRRSALRFVGKLFAVLFGLWWIVAFASGFVGAFLEEGGATPDPSRSIVPTPTVGSVIGWEDIAVGDCLVPPTEEVFYEIRRVPCDTPHGAEVFALVTRPGAEYPGPDAIASFARAECHSAFAKWAGTPFDDQELLGVWWFSPSKESWDDGDRTIQCYLGLADDSLATRSYRAASP